MGIGISIFVGVVGAVLRYAVTGPENQQGFNIHTGGVILMVAGGIGLLLSMLFWSNFSPYGNRGRSSSRSEQTITEDGHETGRVVRETRDHVTS